MERKLLYSALFVFLMISISYSLSIGPPPPPCLLVNHKTKQCIDPSSTSGYSFEQRNPVALGGGCGSTVVEEGQTPYVLPEGWETAGGKNCREDYPSYSVTALGEEKEVTLSSVLSFISNSWGIILFMLFPFILIPLAVILAWRLNRKKDRPTLICILFIVFSISWMFSSALMRFLLDIFYIAWLSPATNVMNDLLKVELMPPISLILFLAGLLGLIWLNFKKGMGAKEPEKKIGGWGDSGIILVYVLGTISLIFSSMIFFLVFHATIPSLFGPENNWLKEPEFVKYFWEEMALWLFSGIFGAGLIKLADDRRKSKGLNSLLGQALKPLGYLFALFTISVFVYALLRGFSYQTGLGPHDYWWPVWNYWWLLEMFLFGGMTFFVFRKIRLMAKGAV